MSFRSAEMTVDVTVNSDDPPMFQTDLVDNYMQVADVFNLTADDVENLAGKVSQLRAELFNQ